jgi:hypothetical protein
VVVASVPYQLRSAADHHHAAAPTAAPPAAPAPLQETR